MNKDKSINPRIIFFGTPDIVVSVFERLYVSGYVPEAVITAPDQPVGRKKILTPPPIKTAALGRNIPVLQPENLKDPEFFEDFSSLKPDLCIVAAYGKLIPEKYLSIPKFGWINIHPSLLPEYRGPSPIQAAIMDGKKETGVSLILLDKEMDHGPLLAAETVPLDPHAYYPDIARELFEHSGRMLIDILPKWLVGDIKASEQNHAKATVTQLITRQDGKIDWGRPGEDIYNQIRALSHEPGTWTTWNGKTLRIIKAKPSSVCLSENPRPGTVLLLSGNSVVTTGSCPLILEIVQIEGGKPMSASEFIRGHSNFIESLVE